jgi:hypothetical protein
MKKTWTEKEAFELIEKVEVAFMAHLAVLEQPLEKSEAKVEAKAEEIKETAPQSGEVAMEKAEVKEIAAQAQTELQPVVEVKAEEVTELSKNEACEYNDEDVEEMNKLYKSMAESERKAHYSALKKAMASGEMEKSEKQETAVLETAKESDEVALLKAELEATKTANSELKKNFEGVIEALKARFTKKPAAIPKQKAITELGVLGKSEGKNNEENTELTREQIIKKLSEKAKEPTLKKSDRDAINAFCHNKVNVTAIKHLITD